MKKIDARGLSCPEPVLLLRRALVKGEDEYVIIVDNGAAKENCLRYGQYQGYRVEIAADGEAFELRLFKKEADT